MTWAAVAPATGRCSSEHPSRRFIDFSLALTISLSTEPLFLPFLLRINLHPPSQINMYLEPRQYYGGYGGYGNGYGYSSCDSGYAPAPSSSQMHNNLTNSQLCLLLPLELLGPLGRLRCHRRRRSHRLLWRNLHICPPPTQTRTAAHHWHCMDGESRHALCNLVFRSQRHSHARAGTTSARWPRPNALVRTQRQQQPNRATAPRQ